MILAVFTAGTIVLVWTAFYLTYTEPGSSCIQGVQGRYFLPVLLPLCLLAGNRRIGLRITDRAQNLCIIGMSGSCCSPWCGQKFWYRISDMEDSDNRRIRIPEKKGNSCD